jgi:hypothetical protein
MSKESDRSYHEARARDELKRAEESTDPSIARVHRELAALHRRRMLAIVEPAEAELQVPEHPGRGGQASAER